MNAGQLNYVSCSTSDYPKEITVRIDGESQPILIIPYEEETEDPLKVDYVNVRIQVEPENLSTKVDEAIKQNGLKRLSKKCNKRPFVCDLCSKTYTTKQHLDRHVNLHSMEKLYPCEECDKVLLDRSYLLRHMKIHVGVRHFKCGSCDKAFLTPSSLRRHETLHNPDLRHHICPQCEKRFPDNSSLQKHIHTHTGVKKHVCAVCGKGFSHLGDYNIHVKSHDPVKEYRCDDCGKEFSRHNNMVRHRAVHSLGGERRHTCETCNVSFLYAGTLTRHILSCHPEKAIVRKSFEHPESLSSQVQSEKDVDGDLAVLNSETETNRTSSNESVQMNSSQHITLVKSSPSAFQIYRLNDLGVLERIAESVSVEMLSDRIQGNQNDPMLLEA